MDGLLNVLVYKCFLDEMRKQKDTLPKEAQAGFMIFEQALMDAISYQKNKLNIDNLIKKLYEESKCVVINGERYYSINTIKNALKELESDEVPVWSDWSEMWDEEKILESDISDWLNGLLNGGDNEEDKGSEE